MATRVAGLSTVLFVTVLAVGCRECNKVVDWDRFNQIDFTYQRERLYSLARKWGVRGVLPERNSIGAPNIELIREHVNVLHGMDGVLGFNTLPTTKPPLIEGLAIGLSHHGYKVPKAAADELRAYQVELSTSGHPKFGAPEGLHDDCVIALALCWYAMTSGGVSTPGGSTMRPMSSGKASMPWGPSRDLKPFICFRWPVSRTGGGGAGGTSIVGEVLFGSRPSTR